MSNSIAVVQNTDSLEIKHTRESGHWCPPIISKVVDAAVRIFKGIPLKIKKAVFSLMDRCFYDKAIVSSSQVLINLKKADDSKCWLYEYAWRIRIYNFLNSIPLSDREEVLTIVKSFIDSELHHSKIITIIKAVAKVFKEEGKEGVIRLQTFMMSLNKECKTEVIEAAAAIPLSDREEVLTIVKSFIDSELHHSKIITIIKAVAKVFKEEEKEGIIRLQTLIMSLNKECKTEVIEAAAAISVSDRKDVLTKVGPLLNSEMDRRETIIIIKAIANIFPQFRTEFTTKVQSLVQSLNKQKGSRLVFYLVENLIKIFQEGGIKTIETLMFLDKLKLHRSQLHLIIESVVKVPFQYRMYLTETLVNLIKPLELDQVELNDIPFDLDLMINHLAQIVQEEGEEGIKRAISLIKLEKKFWDMYRTIYALSEVSFEGGNRKDVISKIEALNELRGSSLNTYKMISTVAKIPFEERGDVMKEVLSEMREFKKEDFVSFQDSELQAIIENIQTKRANQ